MSTITLKSLHNYLKLLENPSELKRRLPTSSNPRTLKEGLNETSKLVGVDEAVFKDPKTITALIGAQRFVMIWGEPSVTDHVARVFDNSRLLVTGLVSAVGFESATVGQISAGPQQGGAMAALAPGWTQRKSEPPAAQAQPSAEEEIRLDSLKPLLSGNTPLTCRLFRAVFEHMLGFALQSSAPQGGGSLVNDLTGSKEHSRSFLSTALFILGVEVEPDHLISFMMQRGLFGMPIFEHLLQNRDYCEAFLSFRRLERAFMGPPAAEEAQFRNRLDQFNAQFGGKPCDGKIFEADEQDKAKIDAYLAAADLLEALALTPWCMSLTNAVSVASSNSIRSASVIASHFERFGRGEVTKDRANQKIADHLLAFARQFSADTKPA
ncbi:MAG: hypothetical protein NT154_36595 [Verrucomicrobia bacterium]|nr:hypothetical protein [Verrucomicrobiota bacterium]